MPATPTRCLLQRIVRMGDGNLVNRVLVMLAATLIDTASELLVKIWFLTAMVGAPVAAWYSRKFGVFGASNVVSLTAWLTVPTYFALIFIFDLQTHWRMMIILPMLLSTLVFVYDVLASGGRARAKREADGKE